MLCGSGGCSKPCPHEHSIKKTTEGAAFRVAGEALRRQLAPCDHFSTSTNRLTSAGGKNSGKLAAEYFTAGPTSGGACCRTTGRLGLHGLAGRMQHARKGFFTNHETRITAFVVHGVLKPFSLVFSAPAC